MSYQPTIESLAQHQVPNWYDDAKLGIFVHWGLYSVPAWAPHGADIDKQVNEKGWEGMFANNPYAEWYLNTLRVGDTATQRHHSKTYGERTYDDFVPIFQREAEKWDPESWVQLFAQVGARYVVLTTKHHDGFLLWPSAHRTPHKRGGYALERDVIAELRDAARQHNMRMGLYYSGGLDWSYNETPVRSYIDVYSTIVQNEDFIQYVTSHWYELIDRYEPAILWNDIGAPAAMNLLELFAYYYNKIPDGLINDRWSQQIPTRVPGPSEMINPPPAKHCDYLTPEYAAFQEISPKKWEATRGIGHSFGYNQNEGEDDYLSVNELVRSFVDIVSKNGNLLLNVGPMADGTIPALQRARLIGLGKWLNDNDEAIFGTRPWIRAQGRTSAGIAVRYTQTNDALYAILLDSPQGEDITIENLVVSHNATIRLLGYPEMLTHQQRGNHLTIRLPATLKFSPAYTFQITPKPRE